MLYRLAEDEGIRLRPYVNVVSNRARGILEGLAADSTNKNLIDYCDEFLDSTIGYLKATHLLVSCLDADCYVSNSTRSTVLDGLLRVPGTDTLRPTP